MNTVPTCAVPRSMTAGLWWAWMADVLVTLHALWAAFLVLLVPALWWGHARGATWPARPGLRLLHLLGILIVPLEDALGVPCPVTAAERYCRARGGQASYDGDFLAHAAHTLLYFNAPGWFFVALHAGFAAVVVLTFWRIPPRFNRLPEPAPPSTHPAVPQRAG